MAEPLAGNDMMARWRDLRLRSLAAAVLAPGVPARRLARRGVVRARHHAGSASSWRCEW